MEFERALEELESRQPERMVPNLTRIRALARKAGELYREVGGERLARAEEVELWLAQSDATMDRVAR